MEFEILILYPLYLNHEITLYHYRYLSHIFFNFYLPLEILKRRMK
jgi:hypothetical protein